MSKYRYAAWGKPPPKIAPMSTERATAAVDVERLGLAMECHVAERVGLNEEHTCERECGPLIAAEYARLSGESE